MPSGALGLKYDLGEMSAEEILATLDEGSDLVGLVRNHCERTANKAIRHVSSSGTVHCLDAPIWSTIESRQS
jgi:hypothetical protein